MEKEKFEKIISGIQVHINNQLEIVGKCEINGMEISFANLSIKAFNEIIVEAQQLQRIIDRIIMVDLYHLLTMGNLSSPQKAIFIKKIKELLQYRSVLKVLTNSSQVKSTASLHAKYTSKTLEYSLQV